MGETSNQISVLGKLSKYSGSGHLGTFLKAFEKRATLEKWTEEDKAALLRLLCTDSAEIYIDSLADSQSLGYNEICQALKERFTIQISKAEAYSQLMALRQNKESIEKYITRIEKEILILNDSIPEIKTVQGRDEIMISVFLNGLDPIIKRTLSAHEYKTFAEISRAATKIEATTPDLRRPVHAVSEETNKPNRNNFENYKQPGCWHCGNPHHIRRYCNLYQHERSQNAYRGWNKDQGYRYPTRGRRPPFQGPKN